MGSQALGWLLGVDDLQTVDQIRFSFAAPWASDPTWLVVGVLATVAFALWYYYRIQQGLTSRMSFPLAILRGLVLVLLLVTLADPTVRLTANRELTPIVYTVFDGTQSMDIIDTMPPDELLRLQGAVPGSIGRTDFPVSQWTRQDWIKSYLKEDASILAELAKSEQIEIEPFLFDGTSTSALRRISVDETVSSENLGPAIADQLTVEGRVTALGEMLVDLENQAPRRLGAVLLFSDFAQNSGLAPLGSTSDGSSPLQRLRVPIHTIGVGAISTRDLQVDIQPPLKMKKAERSTITVRLNQSGAQGESARVTVTARPLQGDFAENLSATEILVGSQDVLLDSSFQYFEFPFVPEQAGRFQISATAESLPGEVSFENNQSSRAVNIVDDYIRLTYIESEPNWEWRFVKEVFHRDRLVGIEGFRTFLRSADPKVRQSNPMFLPTLTPTRSEFFANDVIFLGDMPSEGLNQRFSRMLKQFVGQFGGGLVILAGPQYGPQELIDTEIADMLPVKLDRSLTIRSGTDFRPVITPLGKQADIMQLSSSANGAADSVSAWDNLGQLSWYQPVLGLHSQANVLAEHPTDRCADGRTPQPLIATRRYGNGEVVYIGFNELWRLRRMHGEQYYRQFWSQVISRLALSHALGSQKRFVLSMDQPKYQVDDRALLTVEAYDDNFDPLTLDSLPSGTLDAEIVVGDNPSATPTVVKLSQARPGRFEARLPVYEDGRYTVRVIDPIHGTPSEIRFDVVGATVESRNPSRNVGLQQAIAATSGGKSYDLSTARQIASQLRLEPAIEEISRSIPVWATPAWLLMFVVLLFAEWLLRKRANLA